MLNIPFQNWIESLEEFYNGPRILFLMGATATGKSALALELAERFSAEIVNCDSVQVYEKLNIGAAKPSEDDLKRVPHHLYSFVSAPHLYTAGQYRRDALELFQKSKKPLIVVGGTGFYFRALEKGMHSFPPTTSPIKEAVQKEINEKGNEQLYQEILQKDPEYAKKISINDRYRIQKAIEIFRSSDLIPSEIRKSFTEKKFPYPLLKLHLFVDRQELRIRAAKRIEKMLENGLIDEVQSLIDQGLEAWSPMQSVGYKEVKEYLQEGGSLSDLKNSILKATMQLAKRQVTWFKKETEMPIKNCNQAMEQASVFFS